MTGGALIGVVRNLVSIEKYSYKEEQSRQLK